jgi:hypothetical protein
MLRHNFDPTIWGSKAWDFMHYIALSYPTHPTINDKRQYKNFFMQIGKVLPCDKCVDNYTHNHINFTIDQYLSGPTALFNWTVLMRNEVKKMNKQTNFHDKKTLKNYLMNVKQHHHQNYQKCVLFFGMLLLVISYVYYFSHARIKNQPPDNTELKEKFKKLQNILTTYRKKTI